MVDERSLLEMIPILVRIDREAHLLGATAESLSWERNASYLNEYDYRTDGRVDDFEAELNDPLVADLHDAGLDHFREGLRLLREAKTTDEWAEVWDLFDEGQNIFWDELQVAFNAAFGRWGALFVLTVMEWHDAEFHKEFAKCRFILPEALAKIGGSCQASDAELNVKAREFLATNPLASIRSVAKSIGCSAGKVHTLPVWTAVMEERRKGRMPKSLKAVSIAAELGDERHRDEPDLDETQSTLDGLIAEQVRDGRTQRVFPRERI